MNCLRSKHGFDTLRVIFHQLCCIATIAGCLAPHRALGDTVPDTCCVVYFDSGVGTPASFERQSQPGTYATGGTCPRKRLRNNFTLPSGVDLEVTVAAVVSDVAISLSSGISASIGETPRRCFSCRFSSRSRSHSASASASFGSVESDALMVEFARRRHGFSLRKNCSTTPKCFSMFGSRLHSAAISENGLDHEAGGGMSADGISCVLRR